MCNLICFAIWEANWQRSETRLAVENMAACEQICWNCTHDVPVISLLFAVEPSNASAMCAYASAMHMCIHVYASAVQMYVQMLCICAWLHMHVRECNAMQCNTRQLRTRGLHEVVTQVRKTAWSKLTPLSWSAFIAPQWGMGLIKPCIEPWVDNSDVINAFCNGAAFFTKTAGKWRIDRDQMLGVQLFPDGLRKASLSRGKEVLCCATHDCSSSSPWAFFATWLSAVLRLLAAFTFLHVSRNN